ncbi:hypothetical protein IWX92DRAFT_3944 [Phyllosticta citricarpa]
MLQRRCRPGHDLITIQPSKPIPLAASAPSFDIRPPHPQVMTCDWLEASIMPSFIVPRSIKHLRPPGLDQRRLPRLPHHRPRFIIIIRHHEEPHDDEPRATPRASSNRAPPKTRQPHNMVEKKYREGLNNELERLRRAVRTLPQPPTRSLSSDDDDDDGYGYSTSVPKPSKAAVLAGAVEYIRYLETEHERLRSENEQLRELEGLRRRREEGWVWRNRAADPLGFLS